jgi:hypothetical protein
MKKNHIGVIVLAAAFILFGSSFAGAQTGRRKPKPLATPLPTLSGAEIISRAGDLETDSPTVERTPQKAPSTTSSKIRTLNDRVDRLESTKKEDPDAKQRRMLLNLDILTRAEQRSESLRKQLFEMTEKENSIKTRLDQIDIDSRPEMIERSLQIAGSMRPEEVRDARRRSLDAEKGNLESLLTQLQSARASLSLSLDKADAMVDKLRTKLDKEIDDTFLKDDQPEQ